MHIGLIGYGRMGREIEAIALSRGHEVVARIEGSGVTLPDADAYIDFSLPEGTREYAPLLAKRGTPLVIGTTGWDADKATLAALFTQSPAIYGSNFSLGVQLFLRMVREATRIAAPHEATYDIALCEAHHRMKRDAPSGTALSLAREVLQHSSVKKTLLTETPQREIAPEELQIGVTRLGNIPGTHTVQWDSAFDTITLTHTARTRSGFALGAVLAAEKAQMLPAGLHEFTQVFDRLFA